MWRKPRRVKCLKLGDAIKEPAAVGPAAIGGRNGAKTDREGLRKLSDLLDVRQCDL